MCKSTFFQDFYPCLSFKFVTDEHTVVRKWLTGCDDLASWIVFMGVSILWLGLSRNYNNISLLYYVKRNLLYVGHWDGK